jgi:hypothetical protein
MDLNTSFEEKVAHAIKMNDDLFLHYRVGISPDNILKVAQYIEPIHYDFFKEVDGIIRLFFPSKPGMVDSYSYDIGREYSRVIYITFIHMNIDNLYNIEQLIGQLQSKYNFDEFTGTKLSSNRYQIRIWWD